MKKGIAGLAVAATTVGVTAFAVSAGAPADDDALRERVEETFDEWLAELDPIGSEFYAVQCEFLDYDIWHCTAIDEGVVSAFVQPQVVNPDVLVVMDAEHYSPDEGTPLS